MKPSVSSREIAKMIDHSLLRPDMTVDEIKEGCKTAKEYDIASVCVKASEIEICLEELKNTGVMVTTVIAFPHGASRTEVKVFETVDAVKRGCLEVDMVLNIGRLVSGDYSYVEQDIKEVALAAHAGGAIVKVILENAYLTDEQKKKACEICERAGADFVKTSSGYASSGATIPDLKLMRSACSRKVKVKAAGGVRTLDSALAVRAIGTDRFGATATRAIMEEAIQREKEGTLVLPDPESVRELARR